MVQSLNIFSGSFYFVRTFVKMNVLEEKSLRLSELPKGVNAIIKNHEETELELTLLEMGCLPGEPVRIEMVAPMGDPLAIQIAGYYLSIRRKDAEKIWVTLPEPVK